MSRPSILGETILWDISSPDSSGNITGRYNDIYATNNSNIYLSYYDGTDQDLIVNFTHDRGNNWTRTTVDSSGNVGTHNKIDIFDIDPDPEINHDIAYISYIDETNRTLRAATNYSTAYSFPLNPAFAYADVLISDPGDVMDGGTAVSVAKEKFGVLIPQSYAAYNFTNNSVSLYETTSAQTLATPIAIEDLGATLFQNNTSKCRES